MQSFVEIASKTVEYLNSGQVPKTGSSAESVGVKRSDRVARRSSRSSHRGIVCNVPPASNVPSAGRGGW